MVQDYKKTFFLPPSRPNIWIILGLFLVSLIFWNRFLRLRLPRELLDFWPPLVGLLLVLSLGMFVWNIKKVYFPDFSQIPSWVQTWKDQKIITWIVWVGLRSILAPRELLRYVLGKILTVPRILPWLPTLVRILEPWTSVWAMERIVWWGFLGPFLVPPLVMNLEILGTQKLHYFYASLFLLALPLTLGAWLLVLKYTVDYGRWLMQKEGVQVLAWEPGDLGDLKLGFPSFWSPAQMDLWGEAYTSLWDLANWEYHIILYRHQYGPFFRLAQTAMYSWNWLLILTYLLNLW